MYSLLLSLRAIVKGTFVNVIDWNLWRWSAWLRIVNEWTSDYRDVKSPALHWDWVVGLGSKVTDSETLNLEALLLEFLDSVVLESYHLFLLSFWIEMPVNLEMISVRLVWSFLTLLLPSCSLVVLSAMTPMCALLTSLRPEAIQLPIELSRKKNRSRRLTLLSGI